MNTIRPISSQSGVFRNCTALVLQRCLLHNIPAYPVAPASAQHSCYAPKARPPPTVPPRPTPMAINVPALNTMATSRLSADRTRMLPFNRNQRQPNYYQLLGVRPDATAKDIKTAYYLLAKLHHPDAKNRADTVARQRFLEISEAYETLSDDGRRADYNKRQKSALAAMAAPPIAERPDTFSQRVQDSAGGKAGTIISDLTLELPFLEAISGTERRLHIAVAMPCRTCKAAAAATTAGIHRQQPASTPVLCQFCKGTGFTSKMSGAQRMDMRCKMCKGSRYTYKCMCAECGDRGTVMVDEPMAVLVPPGTADQDVLRAVHPQTGRPIKVHVRIVDGEQFRRKGHDVYTSIDVPFTLAILGGPLSVPGVYGGETHLKIPAGTQTDTHIRLVGKGVRRDQMQGYGDHVLVVKIRVPQHLTERQKQLVAAFSTMENAVLEASTAASRLGRHQTEATLMTRRALGRLTGRGAAAPAPPAIVK